MRLTAALRPLAAVAAEEGVTLALENHADDRGHEVADVVVGVRSPGLGVRLDTANPYAVIEEPVAVSLPEAVDGRFAAAFQAVVDEFGPCLDILKSGLYREAPPS